MIRILLLLLVVMAQPLWGESHKSFVYDDHGKRDPFWPLVSPSGSIISYESDLTAADMILEGIVGDSQGNYSAIINGIVVRPGQKIGLFVVDSITKDSVILLKDQERSVLNMNKGGMQ